MIKKDRVKIDAESNLSSIRHRKQLKRKGRKYNPNKPLKKDHLFGKKVITAPNALTLYDGDTPYENTIKFIESIKNHFGKEECIIDFTKTTQFKAAAMLIVYAAFDNARKNGDYKSRILWSAKPAIKRAIKESNLPKVITRQSIKYDFKNMKKLPIITGIGKQNMDDVVDHIQEKFYQDEMSATIEFRYGDAVSETINNVRLHAHPYKDDSEKRWWITSSVLNGQLFLAIYDRGVGIPKTVTTKAWLLSSIKAEFPAAYKELTQLDPKDGILKHIPSKLTDARLIYLSMQEDISGTKIKKHGQGSKSIRALVNETEDGVLWVFSNNGLYTIDNSKDKTPQMRSLPVKFPGTLIQWNIKIQ